MRFRISHRLKKLRLAAAWAGLACASCAQKMGDQPSYETYEPSSFFQNASSARPLPQGVVARTSVDEGAPPELTMDSLRHGRERFDIYCAPCHGYTGQGDGIVALRGLRSRPPTFHSDRLRSVDAAYLVDVIRNGFGSMPSYAYQARSRDRWAIAGYIKALQLSQWADAETLPAAERRRLDEEPQ